MKYQYSTVSGPVTLFGSTETWTSTATYDRLNVSVSGNPHGDNAFDSDHLAISGSLMTDNQHRDDFKFLNVPSNFYGYSTPFLDLPDSGATRMVRLLANSNPATPDISLPNFIFELKDLPDMIRQGGRLANAMRKGKPWKRLIRPGKASQDLAAANLALQFGWMPFVSDLQKLATFQSSIDKTRKKFQDLASGKGLRVKQKLGSVNEEFSQMWPLYSGYIWGPIDTTIHVTKTTTSWGVARWKPTGAFPLPSSNSDFRRRALGLSLDQVPMVIWEALPWSFLVDYFINVGNLLQASNRVVATPVSACVMTHYEIIVTHERATDPESKLIASPGRAKFWRNNRLPIGSTSSNPLDHLSFFRVMNPKQLSILASLHTVQSARRRT